MFKFCTCIQFVGMGENENKGNVEQYRELLEHVLKQDYLKMGARVTNLKVFDGYAIDLNVSNGLVPILSELVRSYVEEKLVDVNVTLMQEFGQDHESLIKSRVARVKPIFCKMGDQLLTVNLIENEMLVSILVAESTYIRHLPYAVATVCYYLQALAQRLNVSLSRVCFYCSQVTIHRSKMTWVELELQAPFSMPIFLLI